MLFKFFQLFEKSGLKYRFRKMLEKNVALDQDFQIRLPRMICVFCISAILYYTYNFTQCHLQKLYVSPTLTLAPLQYKLNRQVSSCSIFLPPFRNRFRNVSLLLRKKVGSRVTYHVNTAPSARIIYTFLEKECMDV